MHIWVSNITIIGWDNGLSPDHRQANIWTDADSSLLGLLGTSFNEILKKSNLFIQENAFGNAVCEMAAILSRPQYVNIYR